MDFEHICGIFFLLKTHTLLQYVQHSGHKESRSASLSFKENLGQNGIKGYIYISVLCRADVSSLREKYKHDSPYARERQLAVFRRLLAERQGSLSPSRSRTLNIRNVNSVHFGSKKKKNNFAFSWHFQIYLMIKTNFF